MIIDEAQVKGHVSINCNGQKFIELQNEGKILNLSNENQPITLHQENNIVKYTAETN